MNAYQAILGNGIPPALILIAAGVLGPLLTNGLKKTVYFVGAILTLVVVLNTPNMTGWILQAGFTGKMIFGQVDNLSRVFAIIFSIITLAGLVYSYHSNSSIKVSSGIIYAGGALGVVFAGDFFTLYIFWEIMAVASTFLILDGDSEEAFKSAYRYILIHIGGGLLLLGGIILHVIKTGSYEIVPMSIENLEGILMFAGIAVNAAVFPVHSWLKDSYPEASPEGSVFLSAFTTKSAVYLFARTFAGTDLLIYGGLCMATIPLFYALMEDDIRRTLAYCLINQVGFMLVAIGIGTELGINGATAHAFSHILYKALLFMTAGAVIYRTGRRNFSELGGLYSKMPFTTFFAIIGAMSVSMPFFCGFASKSLIIAAAEEEHMKIAWILLEFGSAGVFVAAGAKFVYGIFFGESRDIETEEAPLNMLLAMLMVSFVSIGVGSNPHIIYSLLPYAYDGSKIFSLSTMIPKVQLLMFAVLGFYVLKKTEILPRETRGIILDTDWFYIKGAKLFYIFFDKVLNSINTIADKIFIKTFLPWISKHAQVFTIYFNKAGLGLLPFGGEEKSKAMENMEKYESKTVMPIGLNAAATILFVTLIFLIASN